ncbi:MAG: hypothetical protein ACTHW7_15075 [Actinomycetaceae bacterium]
MTRNRNTNINDMVAQRRELDRQIRAAKRAEAKAAKEARLFARQDLGVWLTEAVGADSIEDIEALRSALDSGQIRRHLRTEIGTGSPDTGQAVADAAGGDPHGVA